MGTTNSEPLVSEDVAPVKERDMPNEKDALRVLFLSLMAAEPIANYAADRTVYGRLGKFIADQAEERDKRRREARWV